MSSFPSLPLFVDAYLADAGHLSDEEHGRYLRLLMLMWMSPQCRIPNDDGWLSRKLARSPEDIRNLYRPLISEFCRSSGNWLTQKRLRKEWMHVQKNSKQRSDAAKSRWDKDKDQSKRSADSMGARNAPNPNPNPIRKKDAAGAANCELPDAEVDLFRRGKQVLGDNAGGLIKKLLEAKDGKIPLARAAIETAATKQDPREYIGAVVRGHDSTQRVSTYVDPRL